jgi:DHA2 family multidrug resistance protein-like MFS transporter
VADGPPAERQGWAAAAIFTALAMASLDTAIANIALPAIAADLHVNAASVIWVVNVYQIALVATLLPLAALGEIVGHRRIYLGGLLLFILASLACACAWSLPSLLTARALQGLGASGIMSVNTALVRFVFPGRLQGRGFGYNALVVASAFTLGPTVASGILAIGPWSWLFALNIPFGLVAILIGLRTLPSTPTATRAFDFPGALMAAGCLGLSAWGSEARPITRGLSCIDRTCRRRTAWLGSDPQTGGSSGTRVANRPVSQAAFRAVHCHRDLLVCGAGPGFRLPAILLRGHSWPLAGRDRLFHDPLASCGGHDGADRRTSIRSLPRWRPRRPRSGFARSGDGAFGDASGESRRRRHRLAHGNLRMRIWFFPGAEHEGSDVQRTRRSQRKRQRHRGDGTPGGADKRRGACGALLWPRRP